MDKRLQANKKVRKHITDALLSLMKEKDLATISISEIVKKAKVARASYYRNFSSKESILYDFGYEIHREYVKQVDFEVNHPMSYLSALNSFKYYLKHKEFLLVLCHNGLEHMFLELLNEFVEEVSGDMPASSIERYKLYFYAGAIFNMTIKWIKEGIKETPEEMANVFLRYCNVKQFS